MNIIFALTYTGDSGPNAPASVVGKFASPDEQSMASGVATGTYMREVQFYSQIHSTISMRVPCLYCVDANPDVTVAEFVILMEDMSPAEQGDQIVGCDEPTAHLAVRELAGLHAPWWGSAALDDHPWLSGRDPKNLANLQFLVTMVWPGFWAAYGSELPEYAEAVGVALCERIVAYLTIEGPETIVHGDYRLDNMLFSSVEGAPPITIVDWQTPGRSLGASDVAYFIGTSVLPQDRARIEHDLVRTYHSALVELGVTGYSYEQCFADYRRTILAGFIMAVIASQLVSTDERGHAMFVAMAARSVIAAHELGVIPEM